MSRSTWEQNSGRHYLFAYRAITFYGRTFQTASTKIILFDFPARLHSHLTLPRYPYGTTHADLTCRKFRLFPVRSPLLRKSLLLSFPGGTKMFQFPPLSPPCLCIQQGVILADSVARFGNLRIKECLPLPEAYRSLPRPSSTSRAKASTICS